MSNPKNAKTYSVFGGGAAGLYTLWRLLSGKPKRGKSSATLPSAGDTLELYDWGKYNYSDAHPGTREPGARICTWHYNCDPNHSYLELGGMRYSEWDTSNNGPKAGGHRVVTTVIEQLGLDKYSVPFNESSNPLFYLRTKNMYLEDFSSSNPAPYNVNNYGAASSPDTGFSIVENLAVTKDYPASRPQWDEFYQNGRIKADLPESSVFQKGDLLKDIGYWNLMYDQLGSEGYNYSADGNGYTSNVINWNSAVAFQANNEFTPGTQYKTLTTGYSGMFIALFKEIVKLAAKKKINFKYHPDTRLHSILQKDGRIEFSYAHRSNPWQKAGTRTTDAAWLAMPRHSVELVAQASRYDTSDAVDILNAQKVRLYLEAAIEQPSYKVGLFFSEEWWTKPTTPYPPKLTGYVVTTEVLSALAKGGFPQAYIKAIQNQKGDNPILGNAYSSAKDLINDVEQLVTQRLTIKQENQLTAAAARNTIGPSVTDTPIRQVVYFGNNATTPQKNPVYGLLASYDDEQFTTFWQELELGPKAQRHTPISEDVQPIQGPKKAPDIMVKMLRKQLAEVHFGPGADYNLVPQPLEAAFIDWSLPPFNAGYHAWAAHYDIADVQDKIRKPSQLVEGADANIFIVGEAYSNDQAWVEGAYCTAESVLNDFFNVEPIIDTTYYPFICRVAKEKEPITKAATAGE